MTQQGTCAAPQCQDCKDHEYQDGYTRDTRCKLQPYCDPHKNYEVPDHENRKKRSACVCKPGFHCSSDVCLSCVPHTPCEPGHEVKAAGTPTSDTKCERCRRGFFSNITSFNSECAPWTKCAPGIQIHKNGTAASDVVCGETPRTHTYLWIVGFLLLLLPLVALFYYLYRRNVQNKMKHYFSDDLHHGNENKACRIITIEPNQLETPILQQISQEEGSSSEPVEDMDEEIQGPGNNYTDNGNYVVQERGKSEIISRQESQTCTFTDSITPSLN
ncbi:tumor necrosis factor receptor superfamily member 5 isoform X2 [Betta splendens]|nr:tumor necrosis factor receptor superfamily member 5 isoform X2 [Betta splendens]